MQCLFVLGCLLVTFSGALSHGQTGQTGQTGSWNPWNQNNIWNQNQNGWNQGTWNHQGGGMQPNILAQILGGLGQGGQGTGGMGGMGQGQGGMGQGQGGMGGMNQNNIMNSLIQMLMIKPLLEKLGGDKHADDKDDMDKMYDGFNKGRMTYEMLNQIAAFTEFK